MSKRSDITEEDEWFRGERKTLRWSVDDGATPPGVPPGMNSWTYLFVMRQRAESSSVALQLDAEIDDPDEGTVICEVYHEDTVGLPWGTYHYTLTRVDAGFEQILAHGEAVLQNPDGLRGVVIGAPTAGAGGGV